MRRIILALTGLAALGAAAHAEGFFLRRNVSGIKVTSDLLPDALGLTCPSGGLGTITSNTVTPTGFTPEIDLAISGPGTPQLRINGGGWVTSGKLEEGDTLQVRFSAADTVATGYSASLTAGELATSFDCTSFNPCPTGTIIAPLGCAFSTAGNHAFTVPNGATSLTAKLWGGAGGQGAGYGGAGGFVTGTVAASAGQTYTAEVGNQDSHWYHYGGGPRAALWLSANTSELLVAGGGGGAGSYSYGGGGGGGSSFTNGAGTGYAGQTAGSACGGPYGQCTYGAGGGTGSSGGAGGTASSWGGHRQTGAGGGRIDGAVDCGGCAGHEGSNGGDGYYGGGEGAASAYNSGGGGGGSSFAATGVTGVSFSGATDGTPGNAGDAERAGAGQPSDSAPGAVLGRIIIRWN